MAEGTVITIITVKYVENVSVSSSFHCRLISELHTSVASGGLVASRAATSGMEFSQSSSLGFYFSLDVRSRLFSV